MAIVSMTGFAEAQGSRDGARWRWEAKSVNGRGLDLRLRLPPGFDSIEMAARVLANGRFKRGNIQASLTFEAASGARGLRIDAAALALRREDRQGSRCRNRPQPRQHRRAAGAEGRHRSGTKAWKRTRANMPTAMPPSSRAWAAAFELLWRGRAPARVPNLAAMLRWRKSARSRD